VRWKNKIIKKKGEARTQSIHQKNRQKKSKKKKKKAREKKKKKNT
jgi:hypothetical protein